MGPQDLFEIRLIVPDLVLLSRSSKPAVEKVNRESEISPTALADVRGGKPLGS